jgi:16S rRNA (guanine966-N2)-methyltransferase
MRIIAGSFGGVRLAGLGKGDAAAHLRPTPDRVRESLFSALASRADDPLTGAHVLDLFAGTGALGLEALSRGAAQAVFVENGRTGLRLLRDNIARTKTGDRATVTPRDATRLSQATVPPASLVFLDPPYGQGMGAATLQTAFGAGWIAPGALVIWEESTPQIPPEGWAADGTRRYGDTHITMLLAP